jgi:hypothetical protein
LVTCAVIVLAGLTAHLYTPVIVVAPAVRHWSAALLCLHCMVTAALARWPDRWALAVVFRGLLAVDALLCGLVMDVDSHGPAPLLVVAVLVVSLEAAGWMAAATSMLAASVGAGAAVWWGVGTTLLLPTPLSFPTRLAVEVALAGDPAMHLWIAPFPTTLSVETWIAGLPAFAGPAELFEPTLALVLLALCLGLTTMMWRVRKARSAVARAMASAARVSL